MKKAFLALAAWAAIGCASTASAVEVEDYADLVIAAANSDLQEWITDPIIIYAIREQNAFSANISKRKIEALDKKWRSQGRRGEMVMEMLDRQGSIILRDRRELSHGVITEIIVMDNIGLNVAISDRTSDYYQGDEAKWQETFLRGPGAIHVGEIEFDESTQKYQTQVSMSVTDPDTSEVIGAVTFGIDLEVLKNR